ncbi:hypothetical protein GZ77_02910 [Endozoicomonas montiporae]|uniref:Phosphohistidine phosphatase n=2 Tax=Endozoicomonas montiporae TaxID=1027273 RepID=A0A081NAV6_9GAMM|nr:phosphohistidine phosphatase SixA [Endozoicomonas montiporae]AMO56725.1 phosphohistidine phosphatase SixA [Endozoicomonas montiporae CL-33]KEQ15579.1 hypothetical protein GZ77_02910 [Endozoicomonas montiporae]
MKLIIMRHGQASWSAPSDSLRPLTKAGREEVRKTVGQLKGEGIDRIVASPYLRAQQTAAIASDILGVSVDTLDGITPDDSPAKAIGQLPEQGNVLVVSHMPLVSALTGLLCEGVPYGGPGFATANAAVLDLELPAAGLATLQKMLPA